MSTLRGVAGEELDLRQVLKTRFGYDEFRPLQAEIIGNVLAGRDSLVLMPTGGGKSLCYQLPALCLDGLTLVISPLIALMKDQVDALRANGVAAAFVNSSVPAQEARGIAYAAARAGRLKLLYVAPERLAVPGFREFLRSVDIGLVAIDEAHCISEWGHDFRPDYRNLRTLRDTLSNRHGHRPHRHGHGQGSRRHRRAAHACRGPGSSSPASTAKT